MSEENVNVSIGAKIDDLIAGFKQGESVVGASTKAMADAVVKSGNAVEAACREMTEAFERTKKESQETSQQAIGAFGEMGNFINGVLGPIIAAFSLKAMIDEVLDFASAAEDLGNTAKIIGTTATEISRLHASAIPLGIATEQVNGGMQKLARTMTDAIRGGEESAAAFEAIGLSVEDLKSMSIPEVIEAISNKFASTEDGAEKVAVAMALMGRSGAELIPWLDQGGESMRAAADEAERMGAIMGEDAVAAGSALDDAMDALDVKTRGVRQAFSQQLAPAVQFVAEMFTEGSGTATSFGEVFKAVASIVVGATTIIKAAWEIVSSLVRAITVAIVSIIDATIMAAQMDFNGARAALETGRDMMSETMTSMIDNLSTLKDKAAETLGGIWGDGIPPPPEAPEQEGEKGRIDFAPRDSASGNASNKAAEEAKRAARERFEYEMELLRTEMSELARGAEQKIAIAQEMTAKIKEQYGEESREFTRAKREELRIVAEVEAEKARLRDLSLVKARDHAILEIELERGRADMMVAQGQMSALQRLDVERRAEEQLYALQLAYLEQRLLLYAAEPREAERINAEIERMKGEHLLRMQEMDIQTFETNKENWNGYFQTITDGMANSIQGMIFQGQTLQQAMGNIFQNILGQLIQTGVKMATNWIATQLAMTSATVAGATTRTAAEVASAKSSVMANAGAAIKNIITKAAEVFANVYNAIAGIPYVGPFLAPVMAVAAGAAVVGMVGKVASAEGGWDRVPYDGAQAILHKEEMVLPAPLADGLRKMVENGNGVGGGGLTINALDRRSIERYFNDNGDLLWNTLKSQAASNPGGF